MSTTKRLLGGLMLALTTVTATGAAGAATASAESAVAARADDVHVQYWRGVAFYPGTPQGWADCNADGKLWKDRYKCELFDPGNGPRYQLQIWVS
ncbi:hypothetical protein [Spongiactinospora sp. TRM90649]|uniref:hypothetical protein n=1 Tax=Spongiactinospora sp. TRM90649 TaxID=3031114 RepID=UPI0023F8B41F|nr:hypothetical protein [Spongiactinospora sp. TRM90649]MDF5757663.1 hypothetical protein [Spongiactinospora sp. TRM90649]